MRLLTINELDHWMTTNCFNDTYAIGNRRIHEGCGLDAFGSGFVWYYTERGNRENLQYFQTEREAVEYAFETISSDRSARRHLVGFMKEKAKAQELAAELEKRKIECWHDEIPYGGINDPRMRIFVFGCDVNRVVDLQEKYNGWK